MVRVEGHLADFHTVNSRKLIAIVPRGAPSGKMSISAGYATASSAYPTCRTTSQHRAATITLNAFGVRYNPYENTIGITSVAALGTDWTAATDGYVDSSPAVANGYLYVGDFNGA